MRITSINTPPLSLVVACAPVSRVTFHVLPGDKRCNPVLDKPVGKAMTVDASWLPQAHRAQDQAELILGGVRLSESYETNGSMVKGSETSANKRFVKVARGVPPRGRPV